MVIWKHRVQYIYIQRMEFEGIQENTVNSIGTPQFLVREEISKSNSIHASNC